MIAVEADYLRLGQDFSTYYWKYKGWGRAAEMGMVQGRHSRVFLF